MSATDALPIQPYLSDVPPDAADLVLAVHGTLTGLGCPVKLQEAKNGHVVSYLDPGKRTVANLVARRTGPFVRIYADHCNDYLDLVEALPEPLLEKVAKAPVCRRLIDPAKCSSRCPMGYRFTLRGQELQKCRFSCFLLPLTAESLPSIQAILTAELPHRTA